MFKLLRKSLAGLVLALAILVSYYYLRDPINQRYLHHLSDDLRHSLKGKQSSVWEGTVVIAEALEGDKLQVHTEANRGVVVRLAGVDAPEMPNRFDPAGQPFARESKDYLALLANNKAGHMVIVGTDDRKVPLVLLSVEDRLLNLAMVQAGLAEAAGDGLAELSAWQQRQLERSELDARKKNLKMWGNADYIRPVEHRIRQQKIMGVATPASATNSP